MTKIPGSYTSFYVDQQINSFFNTARTTIWQSVGIQLIFAAAFIYITLAIAKRRCQV